MIPTPSKKTKIYIGVAVGAVLIYFLTKSPSTTTANNGTDPTGNSSNTTGNSVPTFNASTIADELETAMLVWYGTDTTSIQNLLRNVTSDQFAQVVTAFGNREYNTWTGFSTLGSLEPLKVWLNSELSSSDYNLLKLKYPNSL